VNWMEMGKFLVIAGTVIIVLGLVFLMADKFPIGRLPGDFKFGNQRFSVYIPVATCVLLSIAITIIVNFFSRK
jgi:hypothetical protein